MYPVCGTCSGSSGQLIYLGSAELGFEPESFDLVLATSPCTKTSHPDAAGGSGEGVLLSRWLEDIGHSRKRWGKWAAAGKSSPNTSPSPACLLHERAKRIQRVLGAGTQQGKPLLAGEQEACTG